MLLIYSIIILLLLSLFARDFIKKNAKILYIITAVFSIFVVYASVSKIYLDFPDFFRKNIWAMFSKGALGTAGFVFVMYAGALPKGYLRKRLMSIRAELSILSSILILAHNISYGLTYFKYLFFNHKMLSPTQLAAAVVSIILIFIMIPLFITSFSFIRNKMHPFIWETLQKLAYPFYILIYVHVMLILFPLAKAGSYKSLFNLVVYTIVFFGYFAMRTSRLYIANGASKNVIIFNYLAFACIAIGTVLISIPF